MMRTAARFRSAPAAAWLLASVVLTIAPPALADDLLDAYRPARDGDPQLQAARDNLRAVRQNRPIAKAPLKPQVNLTGDVSRNRFDSRDGPTNYSTDQIYSVNLDQTLYNREFLVALDQADSQIAEAQANYEAARQDLMLRVAERYFGVLKARENLQFVRADKKATQRQLEQARERFEVGLIAITDVREAQARYDQVLAQEIAAENELDNAQEALTEVTGQVHGRLADLQEQVPLSKPDPENMDEWVSTAEEQNLQVLARRHAAETARQQIERQRATDDPTVSFQASHALRDQNFGGVAEIERQDTSIGLQAQWPLYQGGGTGAQTEQAMHRFHQAQDQLEQAHRQALRSTRDAYRGVNTQIGQVKAFKQAVTSAETALEAVEAGFEVGTRTIVEVLDAQRNLFQAKRDFAQSRYDYLLSTLRLKQAAGVLDEQDLKRVNRLLKEVEGNE